MTEDGRKVGVDTNVLVYAVDSKAGTKHQAALQIMPLLVAAGAVIPLQALNELYAAGLSKRIASHAALKAAIHDWTDSFEVIGADPSDLLDALEAVERYRLSFWDALILATVRGAGCTVLLTEDMQDGATISGVRIMNPFRGRRLPREIRELFS